MNKIGRQLMIWTARLAPVVALSLAACSNEQAYGSGQAWQRNQCARLPDRAEYDRCMAGTNTTYDSYKKQVESVKKQ